MADFKLLGGTDPVNQSLGQMTQGLGFPLRDVEPSTAGGAVNVVVERMLDAASFVDQTPTGIGVATQISFGDAQTETAFELEADGTLTCLVADEYVWRAKLVVGKDSGGNAVAQIYIRTLVNGVQAGPSSQVIIDSNRAEIPVDLEGTAFIDAGDVITFEFIRDTDGDDDGELRAGNPDVAGWAPSPSARLTIDRFIAVQP